MHVKPQLFSKVVKPVTFLLLTIPFLNLLFGTYFDTLGANPIEYILHNSGEWSLRILLLTLCLSPMSRMLRWIQVLQIRRMIGLFSFFYASLHLLCYIGFEQAFDVFSIIDDIWERPFITVGLSAFLMLLPLAITSTRNKMRQMGRRWKLLHRLVYLAVILCVIHFWWLVKADLQEPIIYASFATVVLLERSWQWARTM